MNKQSYETASKGQEKRVRSALVLRERHAKMYLICNKYEDCQAAYDSNAVFTISTQDSTFCGCCQLSQL